MSLLTKVQQAARACICSGQHSSAHLRQLCDYNVRMLLLPALSTALRVHDNFEQLGFLQPLALSVRPNIKHHVLQLSGWGYSQAGTSASRGWCTTSSPANSNVTLAYQETATASESAGARKSASVREIASDTPDSTFEPQLDSERASTSAFPEVDFNVADTNYIRVTGNIGHDPELRETAKGLPVANLFMYVYQGKNNDAARINVQSWGNLARLVHTHLRKGMKIRVDGYLKQNTWLSKDAVKVSKLLVNATEVAVVKARKVNYESGDSYEPSQGDRPTE